MYSETKLQTDQTWDSKDHIKTGDPWNFRYACRSVLQLLT